MMMPFRCAGAGGVTKTKTLRWLSDRRVTFDGGPGTTKRNAKMVTIMYVMHALQDNSFFKRTLYNCNQLKKKLMNVAVDVHYPSLPPVL